MSRRQTDELTPTEAARLLGVSPWTVYRWIQRALDQKTSLVSGAVRRDGLTGRWYIRRETVLAIKRIPDQTA